MFRIKVLATSVRPRTVRVPRASATRESCRPREVGPTPGSCRRLAVLLPFMALGLASGPLPAAVFPTPTHSTTIALTSDDRLALVVNRDANSLSILQVRDALGADVNPRLAKLAEVPVGQEPRCVAVLPDDSKAYVTNAVSGDVSIISLTGADRFRVIKTIKVGTEPRGCALTPNHPAPFGAVLYVANHTQGTVSVINTSTDSVVNTVVVRGNPMAIAITNDGDEDNSDERVFVTDFFARTKVPGPGEGFDDGRQGIVKSFVVGGGGGVATSSLSPLADVGFKASRRFFCKQFGDSPAIQSNLFCPNPGEANPDAPVITQDPQGAFPNQLWSAVIRGAPGTQRLYVPSIGAGPEPPVQFNANVQALVHVVGTGTGTEGLGEITSLHVNLNADVAQEPELTPPTNGSLKRLFGNDIVAIEGYRRGTAQLFLIVSRGGNFVFRVLSVGGKLTLNPPGVIRFKTGNLPNGVATSRDHKRAYVNNEADMSVTRINLETNRVIAGDVSSSEPPAPGSFEHAVLVGKLVFHTALGTPDNGLFSTPIRQIVPVNFRGKASRDAWSSCASCHPDGLADNVVWIFGTGPRRTLPLNSFFSKFNPVDQRISNWSAVMGSITDFNNNSRGVQGGCGFASDDFAPAADCTTKFGATAQHPGIFQHGMTQGVSDALDASTLWVQTVRTLNMPQPARTALVAGRALFVEHCASCHGGAKWTKSQVIYDANPTFPGNPNPAPPAPPPPTDFAFDPGLLNARAQIRQLTVGTAILKFLEDVGTFKAANQREIRGAGRTTDELGRTALGVLGFNPPSLLAVAYNGPFLHDGSARTLSAVFARHALGAGKISDLTGSQLTSLQVFLNAIDGQTLPVESETDSFLEATIP